MYHTWYGKGDYVAIVTGSDGKLRAVWFYFPGYENERYDAGWYYLNKLDMSSVLEAVYPAALFDKGKK